VRLHADAQEPSMSIVEARHASTIFGTDENRHVAFEDTLFEVEAARLFASSPVPADQSISVASEGTKLNDHCSYQGG
jgi:hypothetical protein